MKQHSRPPVKVIFLNTWHGKLQDELRQYVARHTDETTLFCFQEAEANDRTPYRDLLSDTHVLYTHEKHIDTNTNYANCIYVPNGIPVQQFTPLLTDDPEAGLATYVTILVHGVETTICTVHGAPRPGHKLDTAARLRQSKVIIDEFVGRQHVIIGGDFNLLPESESVRTFSQHGYRDLISEYAVTSTRNQITYDAYPDSIQYFADYAFVTPDITLKSFTVPEQIVSDHQPLEIVAEVDINASKYQGAPSELSFQD